MSPRKYRSSVYIGIDNGSTGSLGIIYRDGYSFRIMPTKTEQDYTQKKKNVTRLVLSTFQLWLDRATRSKKLVTKLMIERPLVNPKRFVATASALRFLEATLIVLEELGLPIEYIDSRKWQKMLLPIGCKGTPELKKASLQIGCRMFPLMMGKIIAHGDADGLLIAEYCRRMNR